MPVLTQAEKDSIATKVTIEQVDTNAQLEGTDQVTGLDTALSGKINKTGDAISGTYSSSTSDFLINFDTNEIEQLDRIIMSNSSTNIYVQGAHLYLETNAGGAVHLNDGFIVSGTHVASFPNLTASSVPYLDASKQVQSSAVSPTELGYLDGVTSAIQTQLNGKATLSTTNTFTDTTDSSSKDTGAIVTDGGMGIEKKLYVGTGVYLATSGGTQSELNYYEEYSTSANTWSGPYASPVAGNITLRRIGKLVIATLPDISGTATTGASIVSTEAIPARFRHSVGFFQVNLRIVNNGSNQSAPGMLQVRSDGLFEVFINGLANTFTGANTARFYPVTASWVV